MTAARRDVVLVTVDCFRHDAVESMPGLRARAAADGYDRAEAVCAAPATRGAFAALLGGRHYPAAYEGFEEVAPDVQSLPSVLSEAGYATAGFVGGNPFLDAWRDDFDEFWNDDGAVGVDAALRRGLNRLRFRGRATATDVAHRARQWHRFQSGPRFLWMHLMDPHVPFLPGLRRSLGVGPLAAYRAHRQFDRDPSALSPDQREVLRECYERSVDFLDAQFDRLLSFVDDDAVVVIVGDHGEEFDHGGFGHARLYEECVRVPLLTRGIDAVGENDLCRQLDLPPTIAAELGVPVPEEWEGRPHDGAYRDAFLLNHSPRLGRTYAGLRTRRYKLLRTADADTGRVVDWEAYDLATDPHERRDIVDDVDLGNLRERLLEFLDREDLRGGIREDHDADDDVERRLAALGYR